MERLKQEAVLFYSFKNYCVKVKFKYNEYTLMLKNKIN